MNITLSHDELLVLYDLLARLEDADDIFQDTAERQVLWHIQAQLDKEWWNRSRPTTPPSSKRPAVL